MSFLTGIDLSTFAVDIVKVDEDTGAATWTTYPLIGVDAFERTRNVAQAIPGRRSLFWDDVLAVAIEEPQGRQKATVAKLKAIQGAILACVPADLLVTPLEPARWRALNGLPGNAPKQDVARYAEPLLGLDGQITYWTQDAYDAYCLALSLRQIVSYEQRV